MTTRAKRSAKSPRIEALVSEDRELLKTPDAGGPASGLGRRHDRDRGGGPRASARPIGPAIAPATTVGGW